MHANTRNAIIAIIYFAVSGLVTAWFIGQKFGYLASPLTILFSNFVSVFKWAAIVVAAILLLEGNKWEFIRRIGFACFMGTCMLLSIFITRRLHIDSWQQFTYPVFLALFVMTVLCYAAVYRTGLSIKWFLGWIICLIIGIVLQTQVVLGLHPSLVTNTVSQFFVCPEEGKNS
ncbi:hypothetical protein AAFN85_08100 [Mucilaginibacter sp. CAU 1740]|uniref:hypothetical protein n=1 Tax=Mucilaginibacter sp. CAU 1740 TaxID=3140365 RepID=UPI00325B5C4B